jgi:hypothetical protein
MSVYHVKAMDIQANGIYVLIRHTDQHILILMLPQFTASTMQLRGNKLCTEYSKPT